MKVKMQIRDSLPRLLRRQSGIALIITLILLSVTLVMAVAFLALSQRERTSVSTTTDAANARLATSAALSAAEAQILADALAGGTNVFETPGVANPYNFGLLVSTNYINRGGFVSVSVDPSNNPVNVNYTYGNGDPLDLPDFLQNLANLYYDPRPPVYIPENGTNDFRFYLDLNRNGQFDDTGFETNYDNFGNVMKNNFGNVITNFQVGDPQWVGLLEHPGQPYGPNNRFIVRYAFIAVPIGNALDLNAIHNQAENQTLTLGDDEILSQPGRRFVGN